jgi:hypothetical protein
MTDDARVELVERLLMACEVPLPRVRELLEELREAPRQLNLLGDEPDVVAVALTRLLERQERVEAFYERLTGVER